MPTRRFIIQCRLLEGARHWAAIDTRKPPSVEVAVTGETSLDSLMRLILQAIRWDDDYHLSKAWYGRRDDVEFFVPTPWQIWALPIRFFDREQFFMLFDFGDQWVFGLKIIDTDRRNILGVINVEGDFPPQYEIAVD